jgi:hypothetical protein
MAYRGKTKKSPLPRPEGQYYTFDMVPIIKGETVSIRNEQFDKALDNAQASPEQAAGHYYRTIAELEAAKVRRLMGDLRDLITLARRACNLAKIDGGDFLVRAETTIREGAE